MNLVAWQYWICSPQCERNVETLAIMLGLGVAAKDLSEIKCAVAEVSVAE